MAEDVEETAVAVDTEDGVAETPPERVDAAEPPIDDAAAQEGEEGEYYLDLIKRGACAPFCMPSLGNYV